MILRLSQPQFLDMFVMEPRCTLLTFLQIQKDPTLENCSSHYSYKTRKISRETHLQLGLRQCLVTLVTQGTSPSTLTATNSLSLMSAYLTHGQQKLISCPYCAICPDLLGTVLMILLVSSFRLGSAPCSLKNVLIN